MIDVIAQIVPGYVQEVAEWMGFLAQFLVGGVLVVFIGWAIGYAVRALFDMIEFMTL